jgi:hypothetical protein
VPAMGIAGDQWGSLAFRTSKLLILLGFGELLTTPADWQSPATIRVPVSERWR